MLSSDKSSFSLPTVHLPVNRSWVVTVNPDFPRAQTEFSSITGTQLPTLLGHQPWPYLISDCQLLRPDHTSLGDLVSSLIPRHGPSIFFLLPLPMPIPNIPAFCSYVLCPPSSSFYILSLIKLVQTYDFKLVLCIHCPQTHVFLAADLLFSRQLV